jgi:hypothetical protein
VRGKLLARSAHFDSGEALALEALRAVETTDLLTEHGHVLLDLAEVLRLANRATDGCRRAEQALRLFERKGNIPSARSARALLADLTPA